MSRKSVSQWPGRITQRKDRFQAALNRCYHTSLPTYREIVRDSDEGRGKILNILDGGRSLIKGEGEHYLGSEVLLDLEEVLS